MTADYEAQLSALTSSLIEAEQRERERISQVLHDDLQQLLYSAQMHLGLIREAPSIDDQDDRLANAAQMLREAIALTRNLTIDLSPDELEGSDFVGALHWLADQMHEMHGLEVEVVVDADVSVPDRDVRILLFRTVRELLFNVVKHAATDHAVISVLEDDGWTELSVTDEGAGFLAGDVGDVIASGRGLAHVRQRLDLIGGELELTTQPGDGTSITLRWPSRLFAGAGADDNG